MLALFIWHTQAMQGARVHVTSSPLFGYTSRRESKYTVAPHRSGFLTAGRPFLPRASCECAIDWRDEDPRSGNRPCSVCIHRTNDRDGRRIITTRAIPAALLGPFSRDRRTYPWWSTVDRAWKQSDDANVYRDQRMLIETGQESYSSSVLKRVWLILVSRVKNFKI